MKTYYVLYVSYAVKSWDRDTLIELKEKAAIRNKSANITGALLYLKGKFIQVLEGEEDSIKELLNKIKLDPRHRDLLILLDGYVEERNFPDWDMGFRVLAPEEIEDSKALVDLVESISVPAEYNRHPALLLLSKFFHKNA